MIRLLIVDDLPSARSGLRVLFGVRSGIEVVGEAESGPQAVALASALNPDVVLMDVRMPGGDGIAATRRIVESGSSAPAVVVMTTFDEDEHLFGALEAGATGFVPKVASAGEIAAAVKLAASGKGMLSPSVTMRVIAEFARRGRPAETPTVESDGRLHVHPDTNTTGVNLTRREVEVLEHLSRGLSDSEMATALHIESTTVKWHLSQLRVKAGARNRTALLVWALKAGVV